MKRITENYDNFTKEELLAECEARGIEGVTHSSLKADIIAALELGDEQKEGSGAKEDAETTPPLPAPVTSNIPFEGLPAVPKVAAHEVPPQDSEFTDGIYKMRAYVSRVDSEGNEKREATLHPGESFALCIHPPNTYGRTHSLKNSLHYWEGSIGQFEAYFEKA